NRHAVDGLEELTAAFARHHDLVRGAERLAAEPGVDQALVGDAELDVALDEGIEDGVGNLVADLVRMTLGHGFTGEKVIGVRHRRHSSKGGRRGARRAFRRVFAVSTRAVKMWAVVGNRAGRAWEATRLQWSLSSTICSTRSTMRRRSLASLIRM